MKSKAYVLHAIVVNKIACTSFRNRRAHSRADGEVPGRGTTIGASSLRSIAARRYDDAGRRRVRARIERGACFIAGRRGAHTRPGRVRRLLTFHRESHG